ncbi:transcription initiation factor TFIID [Aureococcus anophagefferens]|uniref:Transcription initiation factor TFIID n=1 Tax=Aureococcus anophagefferens TaxID=44056 RepID=A0ABR1G7I7_AURAN
MDGAVAYAAVEHVAWEARIGWGESSDEGSEGEPERAYRASAPGNAYLDAGDWAGAVRWGGDGESDDERGGRRAAGAGAGRRAAGARRAARYAALQEPIAAFHAALGVARRAVPRGRAREIAVPLDEIQRALFCNTHVPAALLKRAVADVAEKVAVDADDVATRFAPEDVCAYESANAAAGPGGRWASAPEKLRAGPAARPSPCARSAAAAPPRGSARATSARARGRGRGARRQRGRADGGATTPRRARAADRRAKTLERRLGAARRVHEEIGLAPAHLTSGFVDARIRWANFAILRLGGLGRPVGVGAGFSFARASLAQFRSAASRTAPAAPRSPRRSPRAAARTRRRSRSSPARAARALKRTLADMARGDDDEADDGRLLVGDREFRKRGKRGPYRNSTRYDDAEKEKARARASRGAGAAAPRASTTNDLLDDLAGGDGGDGRKAATARDDAKELEALRRDLKDQEERKRDAAARDALRGESGEPEAIRRPPPVWKSTTAAPRASPRPPPKPGSPRTGDGDLPNLDFLGGLDYLDGEQPLLPSEDLELRSEDLELARGARRPRRVQPAAGRAEPRGGKKKTVITFSAQALADAEKDGGPAPKAKKGSVKLNISSLMAKHDEHKAEQRRAKEQRMKDDAASYHRRPAPSRRTAPRQGGARRTSPTRLAALLATRC